MMSCRPSEVIQRPGGGTSLAGWATNPISGTKYHPAPVWNQAPREGLPASSTTRSVAPGSVPPSNRRPSGSKAAQPPKSESQAVSSPGSATIAVTWPPG